MKQNAQTISMIVSTMKLLSFEKNLSQGTLHVLSQKVSTIPEY